jgi:molybdenum cofactor guanylyltransferase
LNRSAIILAGGKSSRFESDKGVLLLDNKPLLTRVVESIKGVADEVIVVTSSKERANSYTKLVPPKVRFALDTFESKGPLIGALTGFEAAEGDYSLLLPYDNPFVSKDVIDLLFDCCIGKSAVVPRWTDSRIEPLHAVYQTKQALEAAKASYADGDFDMCTMVERQRGVRYISTLVIEQLDPDLKTFFNVNTPLDLRKAEAMIKQRKR